jgi:hypothetical protein
MASPVAVEGFFGRGGEAGADDPVARSTPNVDDVEQASSGGEADGCESLFGGSACVDVGGMRILQGSGGFEERDSVLLEDAVALSSSHS